MAASTLLANMRLKSGAQELIDFIPANQVSLLYQDKSNKHKNMEVIATGIERTMNFANIAPGVSQTFFFGSTQQFVSHFLIEFEISNAAVRLPCDLLAYHLIDNVELQIGQGAVPIKLLGGLPMASYVASRCPSQEVADKILDLAGRATRITTSNIDHAAGEREVNPKIYAIIPLPGTFENTPFPLHNYVSQTQINIRLTSDSSLIKDVVSKASMKFRYTEIVDSQGLKGYDTVIPFNYFHPETSTSILPISGVQPATRTLKQEVILNNSRMGDLQGLLVNFILRGVKTGNRRMFRTLRARKMNLRLNGQLIWNSEGKGTHEIFNMLQGRNCGTYGKSYAMIRNGSAVAAPINLAADTKDNAGYYIGIHKNALDGQSLDNGDLVGPYLIGGGDFVCVPCVRPFNDSNADITTAKPTADTNELLDSSSLFNSQHEYQYYEVPFNQFPLSEKDCVSNGMDANKAQLNLSFELDPSGFPLANGAYDVQLAVTYIYSTIITNKGSEVAVYY